VSFPRPLLDVGCGDGHFASVLFPQGTDAGLDPSMSECAESRARGVYRLVVRGDSGALPFATAGFSSVLSNCVFEHIPDIERTVAEIARVLAPGGVFACTVISEHFSELLTDRRAWSRLGLARLHAADVDAVDRDTVRQRRGRAREDEAEDDGRRDDREQQKEKAPSHRRQRTDLLRRRRARRRRRRSARSR
jgi:SAM-dependent methyltransferase